VSPVKYELGFYIPEDGNTQMLHICNSVDAVTSPVQQSPRVKELDTKTLDAFITRKQKFDWTRRFVNQIKTTQTSGTKRHFREGPGSVAAELW
jgi:hypothetical protein